MRLSQLRELARLYSIQLTYEDAGGKARKASREALRAALKTRLPEGIDFGEALRARLQEIEGRIIEPVIVGWGTRPVEIELRLPPDIDRVGYELTLESHDRFVGHLEVRNRVATLPHRLPLGYHQLRIDNTESLVIVAPPKAPSPRGKTWGIFLPLYAVPGGGDLSDLEAYRGWVRELGGDVVATLPLLAAFEDEPSPYSPVSRLFWNERYLDLSRLPELGGGPLSSAAPRMHGAAQAAALQQAAQRFVPDDDFERFAIRAADYAQFRAMKEHRDSARYHLYVQYRMSQQMAAMKGLYLDFPLGVNPGGYDAWRYAEHFAKGASVGAPPDLFFTKGQNWGFPPPDPDKTRERGYDYFRACIRHHVEHAAILRIDHVMGLHRLFWIPEGAEAKDGVYVRYPEEELYAILLLEAHRADCVIVGEDLGTVPQYVPRMMSKHGLRRMYVVQYELKPEGDEPAGPPPEQSIASVNTHDMPTFAGFWGGRDIDDRVAQGLLDERGAEEERAKREAMRENVTRFLKARGLLPDHSTDTVAILEAILGFLAESEAEIVLVNLEDLWLEPEPQNVPGVAERSWRRPLRKGLEEASSDAIVQRILRTVDDRRRKVDGNQT